MEKKPELAHTVLYCFLSSLRCIRLSDDTSRNPRYIVSYRYIPCDFVPDSIPESRWESTLKGTPSSASMLQWRGSFFKFWNHCIDFDFFLWLNSFFWCTLKNISYESQSSLVKFIYCEKATKFEAITLCFLTILKRQKTKVNFVKLLRRPSQKTSTLSQII